MKKTKLPSAKEWDKIVSDAFSSDDSHVFSEHYNINKQRIQRNNIITKHNKIRKRFTAAIIAAAVMALLIPTTVYAYKKITASIEKTAKYQNTVTIHSPQVSQDSQQNITNQSSQANQDFLQNTTEEEKYMYYEFGWLPDGYGSVNYTWGYVNEQTDGKIGPQFYELPDNTDLNIDFPFSVDCENYETDGKTAMINYREDYGKTETKNFGREVIVSFNGTNYLLDIVLTDNISKDDLIKIIDNVSLVPTDEKKYGDYIPWLEDDTETEYVPPKTSIDLKDMSSIGDTVSYDFSGGYDVTLNSAEFTDSFDGIDTDQCGEETDFSELMDEKGNVAENIRSEMKYGDGINTIDEVVSENVFPMHILKVNVTITNTQDATNEVCICPTLFILKNGEPVKCWENEEDYPYRDSIIYGRYMSREYFSMKAAPEKQGTKNYVVLDPGESTDVQIAFFVADDCKDKVYVNFGPGGNSIDGFFNVRK